MSHTPTPPPTVTDAHRRAAFARMSWPGWTYEQAQANPMRRSLIEDTAAFVAAQEARQLHAKTALTRRRGAMA